MKIDRLRAFMSRDKDRPRVIVAIDTDDGLTGWGECYNHGPDKALPPILDYLFEFIRGQDPRRIEYLILMLMQQSRFPPGALGLAAISAIDHCLWDISAKALNVPVYRLLGGNARDRVKVYAGVYTAPDPAAARDEFDRLNGNGASRRSSSAPIGSTCTAIAGARWCAPRRNISAAARNRQRRLRDRVRRACEDLRAGAGDPARQCARALRSAVLRGADPAGEFRSLGRTEARARLHARDRRVAVQPVRVPAAAAGAGLRHHPARHLRRRRPARDAQDRGARRSALCHRRAA